MSCYYITFFIIVCGIFFNEFPMDPVKSRDFTGQTYKIS